MANDETGADTRVSTKRDSALDDTQQATKSSPSSAHASTTKLSLNVGQDIAERLRQLAYQHRLSESSIAEVALAMFFARGDDEMLGILLRELGATLRRR